MENSGRTLPIVSLNKELTSHSGSSAGPLQNVPPCVHGVHGLILWSAVLGPLFVTFFVFYLFYCVCHMNVCACGGHEFTLDVFFYGPLLEVPWRIWPQFQDLIRTFLTFLSSQFYACVLVLPLFAIWLSHGPFSPRKKLGCDWQGILCEMCSFICGYMPAL